MIDSDAILFLRTASGEGEKEKEISIQFFAGGQYHESCWQTM